MVLNMNLNKFLSQSDILVILTVLIITQLAKLLINRYAKNELERSSIFTIALFSTFVSVIIFYSSSGDINLIISKYIGTLITSQGVYNIIKNVYLVFFNNEELKINVNKDETNE